ncbi:MAG: prepilin-type N-terminal cleavage/methylation domain-containing protein [Parcubacteria group bacterium]|nr:prepilin-type N-terminal cleavage/methylation domain-containing protein [Parcubacteria group bacterium]
MFPERGVSKSEFNEGFTILELTITIAIVALLSAAVVGYQRGAGNNRELQLDVQKVVQDLRRVQNYALSVKTAQCGAQTVAVNYGIYFVRGSSRAVYQLFKDCNGNQLWVSSETETTIQLANSAMTNVAPRRSGALHVVFIPPFPDVALNGDSTTAGRQAAISVCHLSDTSLCRIIRINEKGAISVN